MPLPHRIAASAVIDAQEVVHEFEEGNG